MYPLTRAFEHGKLSLIELLFRYGADTKMVDWNDMLRESIWPGRSLECAKFAIEKGGRPTPDSLGLLLWRMDETEFYAIGDYLLSHFSDVNTSSVEIPCRPTRQTFGNLFRAQQRHIEDAR